MHSEFTVQTVLETDLHTHTIASTHAYSTVLELATYAAKKGLKVIAVTDHGPAMDDAPHPWHFGNLSVLPPVIEGVRVLHGIEANIVDFDGTLDLEERYLSRLDWVVASFHDVCCTPGTVEEHTRAYLRLAENPYLDVIGHSGRGPYPYDYDTVIPVLKEKGKLVEINSHSLGEPMCSVETCRKIAMACKKYGAPVTVDSDAHTCFAVGDTGGAVRMLAEIDFPLELIINRTAESLAAWIRARRGRNIL